MKVLSLVPYTILPPLTGGQRGIALFNNYFARQCDMICVTVKSNAPALAEGYPVLNIMSNSSFRYINPFYIAALRKIIRQQGITHLLIEHPYFGWLGAVLKKISGVRLVVHSHNIEATRWKSLGKWWWKILFYYEGWIHRRADYSYFVTEEDRQYALLKYRLDASKCTCITYGIEWDRLPTKETKEKYRQQLCTTHHIDPADSILLFNGAFNYQPNRDALLNLLTIVNPLLQQSNFRYKIVICGKDIPAAISGQTWPDVIITGFVADIAAYFMGADIFLNPTTEGGGIKTKLVEALGYNMTAVSARSGAIGVPVALCNGKLLVGEDKDWDGFAALIQRAVNTNTSVTGAYFEHFYWGNIAQKAVQFLQTP